MNRRIFTLTATTLLLATLLAIPGALAESGPQPGPANKTLWLHTNGDDSEQWLNSIKEDADADPGTVAYYPAAPTVDTTYPLDAGLANKLFLAEGSTIQFNMRFGSGCCVGEGTWDVTLRVGSTTIASASWDATMTGYAGYAEAVAPEILVIDPAEGNLELDVSFTGAGTAFMQTGQNGEFSSIVLPLITDPDAAAPEPEPEPEPAPTANETGNTTGVENGTGNETTNTTTGGGDPAAPAAGNSSDNGNASGERQVLAGMGWLTSTAESLGLDSALNEFAEPVLLLLMLIILALLILLLILLIRGGSISATAEPKRLSVEPGETAEFAITVANRKKQSRTVLAGFTGGMWKTGMQLQPEGGLAGVTASNDQEARLELTGKGQPGDVATGYLRVNVPADIPRDEQNDMQIVVTPLDEEGKPLSKKARTLDLRIDAAVASTASITGVKVAEVTHDPAEPIPGQEVITTCVVDNHSDEPSDLRIVLDVDGKAVHSQELHLEPESGATIQFPWDATDGKHKVKVQVFAA